MQTHEVRLNYQQASQLVQVGRFDEALEILVEIDEVKPNTETIMYLMALCHARTGQKEKALELCEKLINEFDNERAQQLKEHLTVPASPLGRSKKQVQVTDRKAEEKKETPQVAEEKSDAQEPTPDKQKEDSEGKAEEGISEEVQAVEKSPAEQVEEVDGPEAVQEEDNVADTPANVIPDAEDSGQLASEQDAAPSATVQNKEEQEEPVQDQDVEQVQEKTRMQRPLWLVLLWAALLAAVVFCFIYIYFLDSLLNPF